MKEHRKKIIALIIIAMIVVAYYVVYFGILIALMDGIWTWFLGIIPLALSAIMQWLGSDCIWYGSKIC